MTEENKGNFKETSSCVSPERVNKWPNSILVRLLLLLLLLLLSYTQNRGSQSIFKYVICFKWSGLPPEESLEQF